MAASEGTAAPVLEVRGLTKRFPAGTLLHTRQVHAVEDVSFCLRRGEVLALVGESGCGKTTTIRMIARLLPVTAGQILFAGEDVLRSEPRKASPAYRQKVQMIFQDPFASLNPAHTVEHHLARTLRIHRKATGGAEINRRILGLLESVELKPAADIARSFPHQLSGGQRQRVAIARALAVGPELILADEPISMLDVSIRMGILNLIAGLKQDRGIAFVYITHDLASARYIGDRVMVMYAGHTVEGGESEQVIGSPAHPYTQLLLSAVPDPRARLRTGKGVDARGEIPSLIDPPPGCPFAPRCPQVMPACRQVLPGQAQLGTDHWARCHLFGTGA
jgi:peptide/nickel transport system ATP-binding protein